MLTFCVSLARDYLYALVCTAILNDLRQRMFGHLQRLSPDFCARTSMGDITARFATNLAAVEHALIAAVPGLFLLMHHAMLLSSANDDAHCLSGRL